MRLEPIPEIIPGIIRGYPNVSYRWVDPNPLPSLKAADRFVQRPGGGRLWKVMFVEDLDRRCIPKQISRAGEAATRWKWEIAGKRNFAVIPPSDR